MTHHYHISWSGEPLDAARFGMAEEAEAAAQERARWSETCTIAEFDDETCPKCLLSNRRLQLEDSYLRCSWHQLVCDGLWILFWLTFPLRRAETNDSCDSD